MNVLDNFKIALTIKKKRAPEIPEWVSDLGEKYKVYESDERLILDVPRDWSGFKDYTIIKLLKEFGDALFIALVYYSYGDEIVVDLDGNLVDRYNITTGGIQGMKYIKKRLRIVRILDRKRKIFTVSDYVLNLEFADCIVKVLDLYCAGTESGVHLKEFVKDESITLL